MVAADVEILEEVAHKVHLRNKAEKWNRYSQTLKHGITWHSWDLMALMALMTLILFLFSLSHPYTGRKVLKAIESPRTDATEVAPRQAPIGPCEKETYRDEGSSLKLL